LIHNVDHNGIVDGGRHDWQWPFSIDTDGWSFVQSIGVGFMDVNQGLMNVLEHTYLGPK
jgi:hypothetical protein